MRKFAFSIAVAVFYVAYIMYDRNHPPQMGSIVMPLGQSLLPSQQNLGNQAAGSANPPPVSQTNILTPLQSNNASAPAALQQAQNNIQAAQTSVSSAVVDPPPASQPVQQSSPPTPQPVPTPAPTPTPAPAPAPAPTPVPQPKPQGQYRDGQYTGVSADAYYGFVQVKAVISGGKLTDVQFLSYPSDRSTSRQINSQAMPYLTQEAIAAQSANVNIVSGATDTSQAFIQSLGSALAQAKI